MSPALAAAIVRDLGLSPAQFLERAERAQQLSRFATTARDRFPAAFAEARLDDSGRPVVAVRAGVGDAGLRDAVKAAGFTVTSTTDAGPAEHAPRQVISDDANLPPSPVAAGDRPIMGGDRYRVGSAPRIEFCSMGFNATDAQGNAVNITAGHCDINGPAEESAVESALSMYSHTADQPAYPFPGSSDQPLVETLLDVLTRRPLEKVAVFTKSVNAGHDYAIARAIPTAAHRFENNLVGKPGAAAVAIDGIADPIVGAPVCKSGATTGFTCGTITAVEQTIGVEGVQNHNLFTTNVFGIPGDSGGPIFSGTKAVGVLTGASIATSLVESSFTYGLPVRIVLDENPGLRIRTQ